MPVCRKVEGACLGGAAVCRDTCSTKMQEEGFFFFFFSSFHAEQIIRVRDVTFSLKKGGREWTSIREVRQSGVALHRHSSPRTINVIHIYTHLA